jgi:hypothetical protein
MKITIKIDTSGAAFEDAPEYELARVLHRIAERVTSMEMKPGYGFPIRDINGNRVGSLEVRR